MPTIHSRFTNTIVANTQTQRKKEKVKKSVCVCVWAPVAYLLEVPALLDVAAAHTMGRIESCMLEWRQTKGTHQNDHINGVGVTTYFALCYVSFFWLAGERCKCCSTRRPYRQIQQREVTDLQINAMVVTTSKAGVAGHRDMNIDMVPVPAVGDEAPHVVRAACAQYGGGGGRGRCFKILFYLDWAQHGGTGWVYLNTYFF